MTIEDLQELLEASLEAEDLEPKIRISIAKSGELVVMTGLQIDNHGEVSSLLDEEEMEDAEFSGEFEQLEDEEDSEDDE